MGQTGTLALTMSKANTSRSQLARNHSEHSKRSCSSPQTPEKLGRSVGRCNKSAPHVLERVAHIDGRKIEQEDQEGTAILYQIPAHSWRNVSSNWSIPLLS